MQLLKYYECFLTKSTVLEFNINILYDPLEIIYSQTGWDLAKSSKAFSLCCEGVWMGWVTNQKYPQNHKKNKKPHTVCLLLNLMLHIEYTMLFYLEKDCFFVQ